MESPDITLDISEDANDIGSPPSPSVMPVAQQVPHVAGGGAENGNEDPNATLEKKKKKKKVGKKAKKKALDGEEEQEQEEGDEFSALDGEKPKKKKKAKKGEKKKKKKKAGKKDGAGADGSLITQPLLGGEDNEDDDEDDDNEDDDEGNELGDEKDPMSSPGRHSVDGARKKSAKKKKKKNSMDRARDPPEYGAVREEGPREVTSQFNQSAINSDAEGGDEGSKLVVGGSNMRRDVLRLDSRRWFVLGVFCLASFGAMLVWGAISASSKTAENYYNMSARAVALTRYWSVYLFPLMAILASWMLSLMKGLKYAVVGMGLSSCIGALFMIIPSFVGKVVGDMGSYAGKLGPMSGFGHFLVHFGEILNSFATTMVFCVPCVLSATWFPSYQRRRATAIGGLIPMMAGLALCSLISPLIANKPENFFWLLLIVFLATLVIMVATLVVPALPTTPPSVTAARYRMSFIPTPSAASGPRRVGRRTVRSTTSSTSMSGASNLAAMALEESRAGQAAERVVVSLRKTVVRYLGLFAPLKSPGMRPRRVAVVTFLIAMALSYGCLFVWQMSLTHVLISSKSAGSLGRANLLALSHLASGCGIAFAVSWLCDLTFKRKTRIIIIGAQLVFAFLLLLLLGLCLCSPSAIPEFLISREFVIFHLVCIGVTVGAATPLLYELCCEALYPIPEAVAFPLPAFFGSFVPIVIAATSPHISESSFGTVICVLSICESLVSAALIYFGSFKLPYFRLDTDEGRYENCDYQEI